MQRLPATYLLKSNYLMVSIFRYTSTYLMPINTLYKQHFKAKIAVIYKLINRKVLGF